MKLLEEHFVELLRQSESVNAIIEENDAREARAEELERILEVFSFFLFLARLRFFFLLQTAATLP